MSDMEVITRALFPERYNTNTYSSGKDDSYFVDRLMTQFHARAIDEEQIIEELYDIINNILHSIDIKIQTDSSFAELFLNDDIYNDNDKEGMNSKLMDIVDDAVPDYFLEMITTRRVQHYDRRNVYHHIKEYILGYVMFLLDRINFIPDDVFRDRNTKETIVLFPDEVEYYNQKPLVMLSKIGANEYVVSKLRIDRIGVLKNKMDRRERLAEAGLDPDIYIEY